MNTGGGPHRLRHRQEAVLRRRTERGAQHVLVVAFAESGNGNLVEVLNRAVTWAPTSDGRELIGYYKTGDEAAQAAW